MLHYRTESMFLFHSSERWYAVTLTLLLKLFAATEEYGYIIIYDCLECYILFLWFTETIWRGTFHVESFYGVWELRRLYSTHGYRSACRIFGCSRQVPGPCTANVQSHREMTDKYICLAEYNCECQPPSKAVSLYTMKRHMRRANRSLARNGSPLGSSSRPDLPLVPRGPKFSEDIQRPTREILLASRARKRFVKSRGS